MKVRAITALFFVIITVGAVLLGPYVFSVFFMVLSVWCMAEFYQMLAKKASKPNPVSGLLLGMLFFGLFAAFRLGIASQQWLLLCLPVAALIFITELYSKNERPFTGIAYTFLGFIYVIVPFLFFYALAFITGTYNYRIPLGFLLVLWANDTGAYLSGKAFGRHKLFERISPKKTWEGFVGGVLLALVLALIVHHFFGVFELWQWISVSLIISVFGTYGDLVESMFKRSLQVKDSGDILPGHGGLLDRFDGFLLSVPIVYAFMALLG